MKKDSGEYCEFPKDEASLKKLLSPEQYRVARQNGTERPFDNAFWNNKKEGLYVDVISGEPLFSSQDKFDSGTGWPSFTKPLDDKSVVKKEDRELGMVRTEVRSKNADSHLGHVFDDGPGPNGLRYCINSASLKFIPVEELEQKGYGKYLPLFKKAAKKTELAIFGAGCFWGVEHTFAKTEGVLSTKVGYSGGFKEKPTYEEVCTDKTGHAEVVHVEYDPSKVSYEKLLEMFFKLHDPTTLNRQGPDVGSQYRSAIFFQNEEQEKQAKAMIEKLNHSGKYNRKIITEVTKAKTFYPAEDYHQKYFEKNPGKAACHTPSY